MRLTVFGAAWAALAAVAAPAQAQDISQHMDRIGAGSYVILSAGARTFVQVFRGPADRMT
jgi:hypothetical protein